MGHPSYRPPDPRNSIYSPMQGYTPPRNSTTTATTGPQVKRGEPSQGGFQVLAVRPRSVPGPVIVPLGPQVPPGQKIPPGDKAGAGPGSDATKGLLKKPGTGRTLLT